MSKKANQEESLFAVQALTGEQSPPVGLAKHRVEFIAGMLVQHTADRKLSTVERIDVEQIARQALRDVAARLA